MNYDIAISDTQSAIDIAPERIEEIVRETLRLEQVAGAEISIALVDDPTIHRTNRDHLDHDYPTDVISFLFEEEQEVEPTDTALRASGKRIEGEIIASGDTAARDAVKYGWSAENELTLYLVHGLLHLCGYDDLTDEELVLMRSREEAILSRWGLKPHYPE
jgi:probable rRNA maturation factor